MRKNRSVEVEVVGGKNERARNDDLELGSRISLLRSRQDVIECDERSYDACKGMYERFES